MMQHEVDKEIHNLQTNMSTLKRYFEKQIADLCFQVDQLREDVSKLKANDFRISSQRKEIDVLNVKLNNAKEESDGQANSQDRKGSEERPKGHKKASKDG